MKYLQYIIYGVIVGNWLLGVKGRLKERLSPCKGLLDVKGSLKGRLSPCKVQGRYAVVCAHCSKDEYILVGSTMDKGKAEDATKFVEENTLFYIPVCYDLLDPDYRTEFDAKLFCTYIEDKDRAVIEDARGML